MRMTRAKSLLCAIALAALPCAYAQSTSKAPALEGLRKSTVLDKESAATQIPKVINDDVRRPRAFAMQPPVIPHQIDNYQIDLKFNKCMTCHGLERTVEIQAPLVSVTHYIDRDSRHRLEISPRRYFCTQCHVAQLDTKPPVANQYKSAREAQAVSKAKKDGP
jgi:nitrate reductase (cytochrome), electron transfer subunit